MGVSETGEHSLFKRGFFLSWLQQRDHCYKIAKKDYCAVVNPRNPKVQG